MNVWFYFSDCDDNQLTMSEFTVPRHAFTFLRGLESDEFYTLPMWF